MKDYSDHQYGRLLLNIENKCKQLGEERDFVNYLLSMENANSLEELIKIYNNVFKLLAYLFFGTKDVPHNWYIPETWGRYNFYYVEDLNGFLNENILKCYTRLKDPTSEQCIMFLSNLRENDNIKEIKEAILANTPKVDENLALKVLSTRNLHNLRRKEIEKDSSNKTKYIETYIQNSRCLAAYGRIFDVAELAFGKANHIVYDGMKEQYEADVKLYRIKKEDEKKKQKEEKRTKFINTIILSIIAIIVMIVMIYLFEAIGGGIGIIIIIGLIGALPSLLLKGKI